MSSRITTIATTFVAVGFFTVTLGVAQDTEYDVSLYQRFQPAANAQFRLAPNLSANGFVRFGELTVVLDDDTAEPAGSTDLPDSPDSENTLIATELAGNWFQIDLWWLPLWFGVAESETAEFFALGLQRDEMIGGRAWVVGESAVESGRYGFRGESMMMTEPAESAEQDSSPEQTTVVGPDG